jgi:RNase P subunit RPR2
MSTQTQISADVKLELHCAICDTFLGIYQGQVAFLMPAPHNLKVLCEPCSTLFRQKGGFPYSKYRYASLEVLTKKELMMRMRCSVTGKVERQKVIGESEDSVLLRCEGCGAEKAYEICQPQPKKDDSLVEVNP